ncbi:MAG: hypothetical protein K9G44_07905, partial [Melioribacteraceae bacterium]|nr:hypothetical protein [Melioribacteraceae bacterium]
MEFWNKKVNVNEEAAKRQIEIIRKFPPQKRLRIAIDFANSGVNQTREWIKKKNQNFSELEITLEFVRVMYYETGEMKEEIWRFYKSKMKQKIKKDWASRFRKMMEENNWTYDDLATFGNFKNGKVIEATISRGLPSFARLAVSIYEMNKHKVAENNS